MRKDLKTGMLLGLVLVISAMVVISIFSSTFESRLRQREDDYIPKSFYSFKSDSIETDINLSASTQPAKLIEPASAVKKSEELSKKEPQETPKKPESRIHAVVPGDTLSGISTMYYGTINHQKRITDANPDVLKDINQLRVGMRLIIP